MTLRLADTLHLLLMSINRKAVASAANGFAYGILPIAPSTTSDDIALEVATKLVDRARRHFPVLVTVSSILSSTDSLPAARRDGVSTLAMLDSSYASGSLPTVVRTDDAYLDVLLYELRDRIARRQPAIPTVVTRLIEHDSNHGSDFVATLAAYLGQFGAIAEAAASLHVHPNTFRYRLKRVAEIGQIDLGDPEARFSAMLDLRVHGFSLH